MQSLKIGVIREEKVPPDNRTPLTPRQCQHLQEEYPNVEVFVQSSEARCYTNEDYRTFGIPVVDSVKHCDLLLGIKEVPPEKLIAGKTYMFFSHTMKKQPHNQQLLRTVLDKDITLIDYELLADDNLVRLIGFGNWAGIIGAHYAMLMAGCRTKTFEIRPAKHCVNLQDLLDQYDTIQIPQLKIVLTGGGRVAKGALELMHHANIPEVEPPEFISGTFDGPVYTVLHSEHLYKRADGRPFNKHHFYVHPEEYVTRFNEYMPVTDVLINCMFWHPKAPQLFSIEDLSAPGFRMYTISDVSCDLNGSVPITTFCTTIAKPVTGYEIKTGKYVEPYQPGVIDLMTVPNLPNELPKDASRDFGQVMLDTVIPQFLQNRNGELFRRATMAKSGKLQPAFSYLQDYADGKEIEG
jgi:alanine dehydrogenase